MIYLLRPVQTGKCQRSKEAAVLCLIDIQNSLIYYKSENRENNEKYNKRVNSLNSDVLFDVFWDDEVYTKNGDLLWNENH